MFYSQFLLSKKGPLGVIWIAAHLERKLRKKHITETDIEDSVDSILYSEVPIALRITGHLLLGVVRIYARKVDYLLHDCSETLTRLAQAVWTSAIDLPPKAAVAPYHAITLPESFDFDDFEGLIDPDVSARAGTWAEFEHHVIDRDLITLQEPIEECGISQSIFMGDEGSNPYKIASLSTEDHISSEIQAHHGKSQELTVTAPSEEIQATVMEEDILPPLPMEEDLDSEGIDYGKVLEQKPESDKASEDIGSAKIAEIGDIEATSVSTTGGQEIRQNVLITPRGVSSPERPKVIPEDIDIEAILGVKISRNASEAPLNSPKQRKRKRDLVFDSATVITSPIMKRQLGNSSHLVRIRKKAPCTEYEVWKLQRHNLFEEKFLGHLIPGMCLELKTVANILLKHKSGEPFKDQHTSAAAVDDQMQGTAKLEECRTDVDSDVEEEANGHIFEMETISTAKPAKEAEVATTPRLSLQQHEGDLLGGRKFEASSIKRRLDFKKPAEQVMGRDVEAQRSHLSVAHIRREGQDMPDATEDLVISDIPEAEEIQFVPNAAMQVVVPGKELKEAQRSESYSEDLGFLAESKEAENGAIADNEVLNFSSSYDTQTEHFGKFMQDKSRWASRTSAVAIYLREKFRGQGIDNQHKLSLNVILKRKRRAEAARLFFEILVLRSKDLIQTEQLDGITDVQIRPTENLMTGRW